MLMSWSCLPHIGRGQLLDITTKGVLLAGSKFSAVTIIIQRDVCVPKIDNTSLMNKD